jgi:hypothetical protein
MRLLLLFLIIGVSRANVVPSDEETRAAAFLDVSEAEASSRAKQMVLAEWAYATNITESTERAKVQKITKLYTKVDLVRSGNNI